LCEDARHIKDFFLIKELIINTTHSQVNIALLKDKQLIELHQEQNDKSYVVGDIYLGRIKKIMPGLNAAFVDIGYEKDAFLHYLDLGPQILSLLKITSDIRNGSMNFHNMSSLHNENNIDKTGKISSILSKNQLIPVQIAKEPISTKGPRLTSDISFAGRFFVLVPFSDTISISKKIKNLSERQRLRKLIDSVKPKNFGIIIRTVSENKEIADLHSDLIELIAKWEEFVKELEITEPTRRILGEITRTSSILRDILSPDFQSIVVDDQMMYEDIKTYIQNIAPAQINIVKLHKQRESIFEYYGIEKQIRNSFGRTVNFHGGAYLIIEHTEAMHVIDVNSGNRTASDQNQEENALLVNLEAAKEIARQLRLRDLGGIIVVDFIDMNNPTNRKTLYDALKTEMVDDRAKHTILPPSKFGLVQITRQRVRPEMNIAIVEKCPTCNGSGEIKATISIVDDIQDTLQYILEHQNERLITIAVHPYIAAYMINGFPSMRMKWIMKYFRWVNVKSMSNFALSEYKFFNKNNEEILF
jgi:ribonuclease G